MFKVQELDAISDRHGRALVKFKDGTILECRPHCLTEDDSGEMLEMLVWWRFGDAKEELSDLIHEDEIESVTELTD